MQQRVLKLKAQQQIAPNTFELILSGDVAALAYQPGQFVMLQIPDTAHLLRRPFGIVTIEADRLHLIYRTVGVGTKLLSQCRSGQLLSVFGPLGNGFPTAFLKPKQEVLLIAGGIGMAPLLGLLKRLVAHGIVVTIIFGVKTKTALFYQLELESLAKVYYTTEDGTFGFHGNVNSLIEAKLTQAHYQAIYGCGPAGLLQMIARRYQNHPHVYCAVERPLACGIGECYACVVPARQQNGYYKVCEDGPVFSKEQVVF